MQEKTYTVYTDASFEARSKLATYAVVVMRENKILKAISKRCKFKIKNSTECEIYAIYQAINVILSCYTDENKRQTFTIKTDLNTANIFFTQNRDTKLFKDRKDTIRTFKNTYQTTKNKLLKNEGNLTIKWIPREQNTIAHKYAYKKLKESQPIEKITLTTNKFIQVLNKLNKIQFEILIYLIKKSNQTKTIIITQKEIANTLSLSIYIVNKSMKNFMELSLVRKIKNGEYKLMI